MPGLLRLALYPRPTAHQQRQRRRRRARLQCRLEEAAWSDLDRDDHPIAQMIRRRFIEAAIQRRLENGMSLDTEPIVSYLQEEAHRGGGFGGVPASAAAMAGLDKQTFRATAGGCAGGGGTGCAICLEGFDDGEEVSVMPCSHRHGFHPVCITKWLIRSNMCPVCRHQLPTAVDGHVGK